MFFSKKRKSPSYLHASYAEAKLSFLSYNIRYFYVAFMVITALLLSGINMTATTKMNS